MNNRCDGSSRGTGRLLAAVCVVLSIAAPARAQDVTDLERFQRQLELYRRQTRSTVDKNIPPDQRLFLDYGGFVSFNYLSIDDSALTNRGLRQYDLTGYIHANFDGVHDFFFRGRGYYRDYNRGDTFDLGENHTDFRVERLYYQFDLARALTNNGGGQPDGDVRVKVGRDLVVWGNGLTLSTEIDAVTTDLVYGNTSLTLLAGRTPHDIADIDSSRPGFRDNTNRAFLGALAATKVGNHRPYAYALMQRDNNRGRDLITPTDGDPLVTSFAYNSYYLGIGSTGALSDRLAYGVEAVYEGGNTLSSPYTVADDGTVTPTPQTKDTIEAWAFDAQLDYLVGDTHNTRFTAETILASGDDDRLDATSTFSGNAPGSNDHGFNSFGLLNTGNAFAPAVANLVMLRGGFSTFPMPGKRLFRKAQIGGDSFVYFKLNRDGGIDEDTSDSRYLGFEQDVYLNWQLTSDVSLSLRYGAFFPGSAITADDKVRQAFFAGVTFAF